MRDDTAHRLEVALSFWTFSCAHCLKLEDVPDAVNIHDAKTHFSELLARVQAGEEIIIAKAGKPIARLIPERPASNKRIPGIDRGRLR